MKAKFLTIAMAIFVGTFVTSCDKNDDNMAAPSAGINSSNNNDGTAQAPDQAAGRVAEDRISGVYQVAKFSNRGENMTGLYSGVKFNFSDNSVVYASSPHFNHKGVWGADMNTRVMKIHIEGNDLMKMVSGGYRITHMTADGMVNLVSEDGTKTLVFQKRGTVTPVAGPRPSIGIPTRK